MSYKRKQPGSSRQHATASRVTDITDEAASTTMEVSLGPTEHTEGYTQCPPRIVTLKEPFMNNLGWDAVIAHTNWKPDHRFNRNGQGRKGTPPMSVNEYISRCYPD